MYRKDLEKTLELLQEIVESAETLTDLNSPVVQTYGIFGNCSGKYQMDAVKSLEKDEDLEFLKKDARFLAIQKKLSEMIR